MIPETHTLTLSKLTTTASATGGQSQSYATMQTIAGSLQPTSGSEKMQYSKETETVDYKFFVDKSKFTSSANEAELKAKNRLTLSSPSRTFDIIAVLDWTQIGNYYKVMLQEKK